MKKIIAVLLSVVMAAAMFTAAVVVNADDVTAKVVIGSEAKTSTPNGNQVERAVKLSGSFMPQRFKSLVDAFGADPEAMTQAGIAYATDQIIDLFANGIRHVHVYSMNKPAVAAGITGALSSIIGKKVK